MTNKTVIHHPEVLALKAKFAENNFAIFDLWENSMIFPSRKALPDHGMPKDEHLTAMVQYVPESNGWILVFQVKMRKIDGNDPKFGEEPTKKLLEAVCELMKQGYHKTMHVFRRVTSLNQIYKKTCRKLLDTKA